MITLAALFYTLNNNDMKRIILSTVSLLASVAAMAQLPVSTTPENRNVILEEFTGIHCTYCPDGHKRASAFANANAGDVFLLNIHTGGYATPAAGEPDFRTTFGSAIAGQSGLTGYPAGTINRHLFSGMQQGSGTAMSRGDWATAGGQVLTQASYVNIAVEADINVTTRVMTIDLEAYFTAAGASSVNLNVAITQDNIEGPQTGMSANPTSILPNGKYNHGHMLRHLVTGQWGDVVTTTTMGTTVTKQYTWTIPADINGVPVEIGDLNVVAFLVEGQQEVVTGNGGPVTFTIPSGSSLIDLESANGMTAPSSYCITSITPEITVTNKETASCAGYKIGYSIDGGTAVFQTINTALAGGASATHTFSAATVAGGKHVVNYTVELLSGNNDVEIKTGNNGSSANAFLTVNPTAVATPKTESFESAATGAFPVGTYVDGDMSNFNVVQASDISATTPVGGYGLSDKAVFFYFWNNPAGKTGSFFFDKINLSGKSDAVLTMDHAYTSFQGSKDKLEVFISDDCGATWVSAWSKSGAALKTADEVNSNTKFFRPAITDWVTDTIFLNNYIDKEILVKVTGTSDFGDVLYVDNVNVNGTPLGVKELFNSNDISMYPNPTSGNATLTLNSSDNQNVSIRVYDLSGRNVLMINNQSLNSGKNTVRLNTENLNNGVYFVEVSSNSQSSTLRLIIQK